MRTRDWTDWSRSNVTNILRLVIVLLFLGLAIWAITLNRYGLVIANHEPWLWLTGALVSIGPELAGIVIGVVTIDYLNERRQMEQLKVHLIRQMGSNIPDVAVPAVRELAHYGWLYDGSLSGADLEGANLTEAHLEDANLSRARLWNANLSGAHLQNANLSAANLSAANLSKANLNESNLSEVILSKADLNNSELIKANLSRANLGGADLCQTNLREADLREAELWGTNLSEAVLRKADLTGISSYGIDLSGTNLKETNMSGAILIEANLSGSRGWTIKQFEQAAMLGGTTMPDCVRLGLIGSEDFEDIAGPTFEEWKAQYLAKLEAGRATSEADSNTANRPADSGSPGPS